MKKIFTLLLVLVALPLVIPAPGQAIPAFARKYGFNCMMCHTAYPKLNDWGQRYRDNGYQLPGQTGKEKTMFDSHTPIALRTSVGFNGYNASPLTTGSFDLMGLDLLAAGVMHKNVSVLLIYTPRIDEPSADAAGAEPLQLGALESANIAFSNIIRNALNVRVGRFEPAYHLFSSKRSFYLNAPYEIYEYRPNGTFAFGDNQTGIEATGHFRMGFKYALGIVNGTGATAENDKSKDVYLALSQTIGPGDGQSAGQRVGAFAYYGNQPYAIPVWNATADTIMRLAWSDRSKPLYRYGASGSFNWKTLNLTAMYMRGLDDKAGNFLEKSAKDCEFQGAFVELDYGGLWNNRLIASVLYNWVEPPSYGAKMIPDGYSVPGMINAYSTLVRYYLGDWNAVNVALHAEYTYRTHEHKSNKELALFKESYYSMLVDFGF
ncbi:MAG: hypothetical protein NTW97_03605 [Candidatus Krumholzibacteria bacterium]|nr:hypothetical protein [Candidatus Krumholzibacteria bacterium]